MRPKKRSLTLRGHRTSVSLEDEFWTAFQNIARRQNRSVNSLAAEIDERRGIGRASLASSIRVFVLRYLQDRAGGQPTSASNGKNLQKPIGDG